ncbi:MAG: T9SS type A sorting domain-containing protein [Bacteroidales bacterium]|nr:T9SS type A sorting domain-containing protein [Bacteroidales bacterium]
MKTNVNTLLTTLLLLFVLSISAQSTYNFENTTTTLAIPTSQTNYGNIWYEPQYGDINFQSKYFDYSGFNDEGSVYIQDATTNGYSDDNSNFYGNIFFQGNAITRINYFDFGYGAENPLSFKFDVNYIYEEGSANPFYVNDYPSTTLPSGIEYTITDLANGKHVEITGFIDNIEIRGFEAAIDNIEIDTLPANTAINVLNNADYMVFANRSKQVQIRFSSNTHTHQTVVIYDLTGRAIKCSSDIQGLSFVNIDLAFANAGIYIVELLDNDGSRTSRKIILE